MEQPELPYEQLMHDYCDSLLHLFSGERLLNKLFGRVMQSHALGRVIIMHYEYLAGAGERPTLSRLQNLIGYSRTLASFFAVLRVVRLISVEPDQDDRRLKYLVPGPRAIDGLRQWLIKHLECCESLGLIDRGGADRMRRDDIFFSHYVLHSRLILDNVTTQFPQFPLVKWAHQNECGDRIAFFLLREHFRCVLASTTSHGTRHWLKLSSSQIASDLGISKSHVRNVINEAEKCGVLTHNETRRAVTLSDEFVSQVHGWFVGTLSYFAETARRALADMSASVD
ncbi:hypothetical protein [Pandoraea communis]|uniref:Uncharacterized protein n=1 Tax=Pandoraea communis TaxID=2508297 RepID=A0A5E4TYU9_9BURK|nr:hypothetical protein [Pandoraea communis]MDM8355108.1 hypothetical protein [Pandoraea communis]VVD93017.1 hypothetical protein PCO31111_01731 [Pandoraea communis]